MLVDECVSAFHAVPHHGAFHGVLPRPVQQFCLGVLPDAGQVDDVALVRLRCHDELQQEWMFSAACSVVTPAACVARWTSWTVMLVGFL